MYTVINFKTKKELKQAVDAWNQAEGRAGGVPQSNVQPVQLFAPGIGSPKENGTEYVEGPHYPEPHRWYAQVEVKDGIVVKVK